MNRSPVLILDFGSQYTQLIARRIREQHVYCEIHPCTLPLDEDPRAARPTAIILSGGPASVYERGRAAHRPERVSSCGVPVLGICYGMQLIAQLLGGKVEPRDEREYGPATVDDRPARAASSIASPTADSDARVDEPRRPRDRSCRPASRRSRTSRQLAVRGHRRPDAQALRHAVPSRGRAHAERGNEILGSFLFDVARLAADWTPAHFIDETVERDARAGRRRAA